MEEIWKNIKGYENEYQISNLGRIKSLKRNTKNYKCKEDKILKNKINHNGYLMAYLSQNKKIKCFRVHRLVAEAFIPNPENKPQVNHKDGNKQNNCVDNLEWCTAKENTDHAIKNKFRENKYKRKIIQYDKQYNFIKEWNSIKEATNFGFSKSAICQCCRGKRNFHYNYIWKYKQ